MAYRTARSTHIITSHLAAGASHGDRILTLADADSKAQNVPLTLNSDGNAVSTATRSGNTTEYATVSGSKTQNVPILYDANGNLVVGTRTGNTTIFATGGSGDSETASVPLIYDASGNIVSTATRTGNTTNYATATAGSKTSGNYPKWDASGNLTDGDTGGGGGGSEYTAPPTTGWSWLGSGHTETADANSTRIASNGTHIDSYVRTAASAPWSLQLYHRKLGSINWSTGVTLRNSSSDKRYYFFIFNHDIYIQTYTGASFGATKYGPFSCGNFSYPPVFYVEDDNTDLIFSAGISTYGNPFPVFSEARGTWAVPDQYGLLFGSETNQRAIDFMHWVES